MMRSFVCFLAATSWLALLGACGRPVAVTTSVVPAISPAPPRTSRPEGRQEKKKETYLPSVCDSADGTTNARTESWGKHFAVYEEPRDKQLIPLGTNIQFVDTTSAIVIRRVSDQPTIRSTNGLKDANEEPFVPERLDIDVVVRRPTPAGECRLLFRVPGLQTTGGYDRPQREPSPCADNYRYFTEVQAIEKGKQWRIPAGTFRHGDRVEIQLYGEKIGEEKVPQETPQKVRGDGDWCEHTAHYYTRTICGEAWAANLAVVDFGSIGPRQDRKGKRHDVDEYNGRADNRYPIYFDFTEPTIPSFATGLYDEVVSVTATAVGKDGKTRDLPLRNGRSRPTLASPLDGDTVVVKVARKYKGAAGDTSELTVRTYTFATVAGGLHAAASGERKAVFGTTPAFLAVFRRDGGDPIFGFAETFSYTATRRTIYPGFFDDFGFGVHVSVLARKKTGDASGEVDSPLSVGLGAHVSFGANSIQLGAGWDLVNEKPYALIGVSIPDLASFLDKK